MNEVQLQREHQFDSTTLVLEFYDSFFRHILTKFSVYDLFTSTDRVINGINYVSYEQKNIDTGIYFCYAYRPANMTSVEVCLSNTPVTALYTDNRDGDKIIDIPLILVVMNGKGRLKDKCVKLDLTKAYLHRNPHYNVPLYVLCEDERSLFTNEFLKKH